MQRTKIKQWKAKVVEKPVQYLITLVCFVLLALFICVTSIYQVVREKKLTIEHNKALEQKLHQAITEENGKLQSDLEEQMNALSGQVEENNHQFTTQFSNQLSESLQVIEEKEQEKQAQQGNQLQALQGEVGNQLQTLQGEVDNQLKLNLDAFQLNLEANQQETKQGQDALADNLEENMVGVENKMQSFSKQVEGLGEQYQDSLAEMQETVATLKAPYQALHEDYIQEQKNWNTQFQDLSQHTTLYCQQIIDQVAAQEENIYTYLQQYFGKLETQFDQVFQSVSNGKQILASALLTKGVDIPQDASFEQIKEAILTIPQNLYLGTENASLPGNITYDLHHHIDACYTVPVYHVHVTDCYETYTYTAERYESIDWHWGNEHTHGNSYTGVPDDCSTCSYCGAHEIYGGHSDHGQMVEYTETEMRLICGKEADVTIEDYDCGCGLGEGQIIGAHITYQP